MNLATTLIFLLLHVPTTNTQTTESIVLFCNAGIPRDQHRHGHRHRH